MKRKLNELQTKKHSLKTQLKRLEDSKSVLETKSKSMSQAGKEGGFMLYHLLIVGVFGLILGSFLRIRGLE
jgi:cytoskeletal protein RodZ